jgi:hypothetical protein
MPLLKFFLVFIFILQGALGQVCAQKNTSLLVKKYPPAELQEDARLLKQVVLAMHPAVGIYESRAYYESLFEAFITGLRDSLTEKQFRVKIKLLVDELHCGHTEVLYSRAFYREVSRLSLNYSPYVFLPLQEKAYMIANLNKKQDSTIRKGAEITRINGVEVDSMIRYTRRFISTDGFNQTARDHYTRLGFNSYYLGLFGRPDTFEVEYRQGEALKTTKYPALRLKTFPPLPLGPREDSLLIRYRQARIGYRFLDPDNGSMLLKIERFSHRGERRAYRRIFRKLKQQQSGNLVIDLRNNGGGSLGNTYRLLSYLLDTTCTQTLSTGIRNYPYRRYTRGNWAFKFTRFAYYVIGRKEVVHDTDRFVYTIRPRRKYHYGGKVFVLINGGSFSASSLVAGYLKTTGRAVFIGEETGGALEGCNAGITPYYRLPHTGLRVRVPAFRIVHDVCPEITGHGVKPDHEIRYSLKDIFSKKDLELQKAMELIRP